MSYIFTEVVNCGAIAKPMLESWIKFHRADPIHVYGTAKDIKDLGTLANEEGIIPEVIDDKVLLEKYKHGHRGTAYLFAKIIKNQPDNRIIHVDSDVYFKKQSLTYIYDGFNEGYGLVGQRRNYKNNPQRDSKFSAYQDVVGTCFVGIDKKYIPTNLGEEQLEDIIVGSWNPLGHPIIDFFDALSFVMISNGAKIKYLSSEMFGGFNEEGTIKNTEPLVGADLDYGTHFIHFAGIGSGYYFSKPGNKSFAPESYRTWAKKRYRLFSAIFFNQKVKDLTESEQQIYNVIKQDLDANSKSI